MQIKPTQSGGRIATGKTPYADYTVEWDKDGVLIAEECTIRDPKADAIQSDTVNAKAAEAADTGGCGGCSKPSLPELIKGAYRLFKAIEGKTDVDDVTISQRKTICLSCQHNDIGRCQSCGCIIWGKIRTASEACPENKWDALKGDQ